MDNVLEFAGKRKPEPVPFLSNPPFTMRRVP